MPSSVEKQILEELRMLRERIEKLEALLENMLIGVEKPEPDEIEAIKEYTDAKKKGKVSFIKLEDLEI